MDWVLIGASYMAGVASCGLAVAALTDISGRCPACFPEEDEE